MQYEIFTIPVFNPEEGIEKLNRFLRGHKVVQVDKEIVKMGALRHFMKGCYIMR